MSNLWSEQINQQILINLLRILEGQFMFENYPKLSSASALLQACRGGRAKEIAGLT